MTAPKIILTAPNWPLIGTLSLALCLTSILYAIVLNHLETEYEWVSDNTWIAVAIGVLYTLLFLALYNWRFALYAGGAFAISSPPIIARSLINAARRHRHFRQHLDAAPPPTPRSRDHG